jgi:Anti-sigma factor NepR
MTPPKDSRPSRPSKTVRKAQQDDPFELWLKRGLHQLFDDVAREPIPDELLRLIEEDRKTRK